MKAKLLALAATALLLAGCASTEPADLQTEDQATSQVEVQGDQSTAPDYSTPEEMEDAEVESSSEAKDDEDERVEDESDNDSDSSNSTNRSQASATATGEPTPEPTTEQTPEPTASETAEPEPTGFTMAMIAANNSASKCWVAIDGMAYDLTDWISQHRGGRAAIISLCGTDGTNSFLSQHGGQANPDRTLDRYLLGPITG